MHGDILPEKRKNDPPLRTLAPGNALSLSVSLSPRSAARRFSHCAHALDVIQLPQASKNDGNNAVQRSNIMRRLTRQPPSPSLAPNLRDYSIAFKHPHCPETFDQNVIFSLQAYDIIANEEGNRDNANGGLHCGTALVACGIVAGNAWNGYFTLESHGEKLDMRNDQLLTGSAYYFHIPSATGESLEYAVYPSFDRWAFPHGNLPTAWTQPAAAPGSPVIPVARSNVTAAVLQRDSACALTGQRDHMEKAHLCPSSEGNWFLMNHMSRYNANQMLPSDFGTDDVSNAIALRSDIHTAFDDRTFVFVPKEGSWVPHFLVATHDLGRQYHNTIIQLDKGISLHHMLSRFAWAIFPLVQVFLLAGGKRSIKFLVFEEEEYKEKTEAMHAGAIKEMFFAPRARSQSPKKRKGPENAQELDGQIEWKDGCGREPKRRRCLDNEDGFRKASSESIASSPDRRGLATTRCDDDDDTDVNIGLLDIIESDALDMTGLKGEQAWHAGEDAFEKYIVRLRRGHLIKNRPKNPDLYCCDYTRADELARRGIVGKRIWGGSHLCDECLGGEYIALAADL